jgi:3-oxoacyl-[acyl-carrier protein] reductase
MELGLSGLRAIVTGASRGIGWHTASALAAEGCAVGICARGQEGVEQAVGKLESAGADAFGRAVDVADRAELERWVADAAEALGGIDIVVANVSALGGAEGEAGWRQSFDIDMMHTVRLVEAAMPFLKASEAGSIVVVSSVAAVETGPFEGPYGTFKAALVRYAKGLASQLAPSGIRVNAVAPGTIFFEDGVWGQVKRENPEFFDQALAWNPMGRMGTPEEVARSIVFLASPASSFTSGTDLRVDGCLTRGVQF